MMYRAAASTLVLACAVGVQGQFFNGPPGYSPFNTPSSAPDGYGFGPFRGGPGFDVNTANHVRTIHGILAALVFVLLFPGGSILMRVLPGRLALWTHAAVQLLTYCIFIAAAGLGFYLVHMINIPFEGGTLLTNRIVRYHPIIGIVVFVCLFFQPFLGVIHHKRFKRLRRRQVWSYLHLYNGRIMITLGIINGGLGLYLAGASNSIKIAYGVIAGLMWVIWMAAAVLGECTHRKSERKSSRGSPSRRKISEGDS